MESALQKALKHFNSETGAIQRLDATTRLPHLVAQAGLPPQVLDVVQTIPAGKGIAGGAAQKDRPVTICNLQTDTGGGAVCVPGSCRREVRWHAWQCHRPRT